MAAGPEEAAAALQQLRNEVNAQAQRELLTKITEKCFAKCVTAKGSGRLERSEQMCLGQCIDRYVECMSVRFFDMSINFIRISQTVNQALIQRQQNRT